MMQAIDPAQAALQTWVAGQIGKPVQQFTRLQGGVTTSVYRVTSGTGQFVLRVFDNEEWLASEPDLVIHETAALRHAAGHGIATPEWIASESDASRCGFPVLLMAFLPGRVQIAPIDLDDWLQQLASTLYRLHQIPAGDYGWRYRHWYDLDALEAPRWSAHPALWSKAQQILGQQPPASTPLFLHRDYHPMNVLFERDQISGVVDWINACIGARGVDLAHCRNNLVALYGVETADRFLAHYETLAGAPDPDQPYWDLNGIAEFFFSDSLAVYTPWLDFGMAHLTDSLIQQRADAYLQSVLKRL
jgi:Ser/Thr protein kinase RdoA (MazF antagonist)